MITMDEIFENDFIDGEMDRFITGPTCNRACKLRWMREKNMISAAEDERLNSMHQEYMRGEITHDDLVARGYYIDAVVAA
jgi:hypothetical protein